MRSNEEVKLIYDMSESEYKIPTSYYSSFSTKIDKKSLGFVMREFFSEDNLSCVFRGVFELVNEVGQDMMDTTFVAVALSARHGV